MIRAVGRSAAAAVVLTVVFGFAYPLLVTGFGQLFFSGRASGSLVSVDGTLVGSRLAAQAFSKPGYFHSRPSATSPAYNAAGTTSANLGPTNPELGSQVGARVQSILRLERPYNPALTAAQIPVDAVTTSGSGIDPDISPAYASLQSRRVAVVRGLSLDHIAALIDAATEKRSLGFLGEPGVNVLELNLALDRESRT